jgi:hypothetical protein
VEIGAEAALFQEKEYINGIFVAVWEDKCKEKAEKNVSEEVGHCMLWRLKDRERYCRD